MPRHFAMDPFEPLAHPKVIRTPISFPSLESIFPFTKTESTFHELFIIFFQRSMSNESQLTLSSVQPSVSGKYSCEVSADAPSFHTEIATKDLEVVGKWISFVL